MGGYKQIKPRWKKGESGNPNGRPHKLPDLDRLLAKVLDAKKDGNQTEAEKILEAIKRKAQKGDVRAAELILNRGYGKLKETVEHKGEISLPITELKRK